jgi:probable F420-dependent oxidoreductase
LTDPRPFRFGVINETILPANCWIEHVRRVETLGYATFLIRDHFVPDFFGDQLAPLPALMAAASATTTLRIGTLVLDNDYRHPVMLAKEVATLDQLSGGRLELGIGAGWLRREYDVAGMTYDSAGVRIGRLNEALRVINGLWGDGPFCFHGEHYSVNGIDSYPKPSQSPRPPILIGAGKPRMLRLAGGEADIVSFLTTSVASGTVEDDPTERLASSVEQKIGWVREGAGSRFDQIELSLIPTFVQTSDRRAWADTTIRERGWSGVTVDDVLHMPSIFAGTLDEIAAQMLERRSRYGFSYYVVSDTIMEDFAQIVARLTGK